MDGRLQLHQLGQFSLEHFRLWQLGAEVYDLITELSCLCERLRGLFLLLLLVAVSKIKDIVCFFHVLDIDLMQLDTLDLRNIA